jgi:metal-responsive CopG/Arc/MetJ family transcriptional regulator
MKHETQRFTIYIAPELLARLKQAAEQNKRSANSEIIFAIEQHIQQHEREHKREQDL